MNDKFSSAGSFAWSPLVNARDEDHHLLRENGGKISKGDMDGNAVMIGLSGKYSFTPAWFMEAGFHFTVIAIDGKQTQVFGNGVPIGTITEKSESAQTSLSMTVG